MSGHRPTNWQRRRHQDAEEGRVHRDGRGRHFPVHWQPQHFCHLCREPLNPNTGNSWVGRLYGPSLCPCVQRHNGSRVNDNHRIEPVIVSRQRNISSSRPMPNLVDDRETLEFSFDHNANQRVGGTGRQSTSSSSSSSTSSSNAVEDREILDSASDDSDDWSSDAEIHDDRETLNFTFGLIDDRERLQPNSVNTRYQDSASSPAVSNSTAKESHKEIPGFYYDEEQKKYFRISNNPYNSGSSCYTPDKIKRMDFEKLRTKACQAFALRPTVMPDCTRHVTGSRHIPGLMSQLQTHGMSSGNLSLFTTRYKAANIKLSSSIKAKITQQRDTVGHLEEILPGSSTSKVLCLWETEDRENHYAQLMAVSRGPESGTKRAALALHPWGHSVYPLFDKITCIRMAPGGSDRQDQVVYTACDPESQALSTVNVKNLDTAAEIGNGVQMKLKYTVAYTCAWNKHNHRVSVGTQRKAMIVNLETKSSDVYTTNKSDPLSQAFHVTDVNALFSGTRKGEILRHDTRAGGKPVREWTHGLRVGHLHCMNSDTNTLLASDISGKICMYDTRQDGILKTFKGLANTHKLLPFQVDDSETILSSTGTDSYTCLWDLKSTDLLVKIPPPLKVTAGYMPRAVFSTQWAEGSAGAGLIMGMKDRLLVYR